MIENFPINIQLFKFINSLTFKNDFLDFIFIFFAEYLIFVIIAIFFIFFAKKVWADKHITLKELVVYFSGSVISYLVTSYVKNQVLAPRPFLLLNLEKGKEVLLHHENINLSFPSGHSTFAFALAISIFLYNRKLGAVALLMALMVAFGRVLVGVHFPLDVFVGAFIGVFFPLLIFYIWKWLKIRNPHNYYGSEDWKKNRDKYSTKNKK